jgi:DNA repair exonuclease SbcCD ATPase subunit
MSENGSVSLTKAEVKQLLDSLYRLSETQKITTSNLNKLTKNVEELSKAVSTIAQMDLKLEMIDKRIADLESTRKNMVVFFLKTVGSMLIAGALYAFYSIKKG